MNDIHAVLEGLVSEVETRPKAAPVSYGRMHVSKLACIRKVVLLATPPNSVNYIYKQDGIR